MKVSVIIPVYNGERYLAECIESVLNQTYSDLEVVVVNDGSTDNTSSICQKFEERHTRVIVLTQRNGGPGKARNTGIEAATGELTYFLDSDDTIDRETIQIAVSALVSHGADFVALDALNTPEDPVIQFYNHKNIPFEENIVLTKEQIDELYPLRIDGTINDWSLWNKLMKTKFLKNADTTYINSAAYYETMLLLMEYMKSVQSMVFVNRTLYTYRRHDEQRRVTTLCRLDEICGSLLDNFEMYEDKLSHYVDQCVTSSVTPKDIQVVIRNRATNLVITYLVMSFKYSEQGRLGKIRNILKNPYLQKAVKHYSPAKETDSKLFPFMVRFKMSLPILVWANYKANKRYGY